MDEKRIPPLKKALPMNKIPVPTKPFKSFKDVSTIHKFLENRKLTHHEYSLSDTSCSLIMPRLCPTMPTHRSPGRTQQWCPLSSSDLFGFFALNRELSTGISSSFFVFFQYVFIFIQIFTRLSKKSACPSFVWNGKDIQNGHTGTRSPRHS